MLRPLPLSPLSEYPLVSVLVANHNYARYLATAAESLRAQSYPNWELIICDDGSTDESPRVLNELESTDSRVRVLYKDNGGQASAWNLAYEQSAGEIVALLDADDWFRSDKLELLVRAFRANPQAGLVHHRLQPADRAGQSTGNAYPDLLAHGWLGEEALGNGGFAFQATTAMALRREVASEIFPIPEGLIQYGDTYIGRVGCLITELAAIAEPLTFYRMHENNHSGGGTVEWLNESSIHRWVEAHLVAYDFQHEWVTRSFSQEVAGEISINDLRWIWEHLAILYVLRGKPKSVLGRFEREQILDNISPAYRRRLWLALFVLPERVARVVLKVIVLLWWNRFTVAARAAGATVVHRWRSSRSHYELADRADTPWPR